MMTRTGIWLGFTVKWYFESVSGKDQIYRESARRFEGSTIIYQVSRIRRGVLWVQRLSIGSLECNAESRI